MRIGIVTVLNEYLNYGAYLQAFALQAHLRTRNLHVEFVQQSSFQRTRTKFRRILSRHLRRLAFNVRLHATFSIANRRLNTVRHTTDRAYDVVILGSDEIWNLKNRTFGHSPIYFGADLNAKRIVSYAPSANGMGIDDFAGNPIERALLQRIDCLSARDPKTVQLLEAATSRNAVEVLDPTFLVDWTRHEKPVDQAGYVLVYCYDLNERRARMVQELARHTGARVIRIGQHSEARTVVADPLAFLGYIRNARAVVTDSYHGTLLSIQYNRPFCCFVEQNYKISAILAGLGLQPRNSSDATSLVGLFDREIDYADVNREVARRKKVSEQFLDRALAPIQPSQTNALPQLTLPAANP